MHQPNIILTSWQNKVLINNLRCVNEITKQRSSTSYNAKRESFVTFIYFRHKNPNIARSAQTCISSPHPFLKNGPFVPKICKSY